MEAIRRDGDRALLDALPNPVMITDEERRVVALNRAAGRMTGHSFEEMAGKPCRLMGLPLCGTADCCIERFLRGEPPAIQRVEEGWTGRFSVSRYHLETGDGFVCMAVDITELAERQLRDSLIRDAMCAYEVNLTQDVMITIAPGWTDLLDLRPGSSYTEALFAARTRAVHPEDCDAFVAACLKRAATGKTR